MADSDAPDPADNQPPGYVPPKVWTWDKASGGRFASINRPVSGATHDQALPVGRHRLQLYSLGTPNGVKVTIMLEELLAAGHADADYDAWLIRIGEGDQFGSRLRRGQPEQQDPGDDGPQHGSAAPPVRERLDPRLSRREVRRLPADRAPQARGDLQLADVADGRGAVRRWRLRAFLSLCPVQDRICDRPLRDGDEAAAACARHASRRPRISGRRRVYDRRHGGLPLVRCPAPRRLWRGGIPVGGRLSPGHPLGGRDPGAGGGAARAARQCDHPSRRRSACPSVTRRRTSTGCAR